MSFPPPQDEPDSDSGAVPPPPPPPPGSWGPSAGSPAPGPAAESAPPPAYGTPPTPGYGGGPPPAVGFGGAPGYPMPAAAPAASMQTDGLAVAALVCGILGLVFLCAWGLGAVLSLIALILGLVSRSRIRQSPVQLRGNGMAVAGIVMGVVGLAIGAIVIVILLVALGASSTGTYT